MRVLLVEDQHALGEGIQTGLRQAGFTVDWVQLGQHAINTLATETFSVIILDLGLPDIDGIDVLHKVRQKKVDTPCLILTARDQIKDRVEGLDSGADDYLTKPFDIHELVARIRALIRRSAGRAVQTIEHGELVIHPEQNSVFYKDQSVELTASEFKILLALLESKGKVLTRDALTQMLYGWDDGAEGNSLEVHIHHIRKKTYNELIKTVRGVGYVVEK